LVEGAGRVVRWLWKCGGRLERVLEEVVWMEKTFV